MTGGQEDPNEKAAVLERSVRAIEAAILKQAPSYDEETFRIETRKIVTVDGVRHELDIWVEVELGPGYEPVFVFESKNWEAKVGKNEILIFSKKIDAVGAQHGFFVAKSFTSDAKAQAAVEPRMTLLTATDLPTEGVPIPYGFHGICEKAVAAEINLRFDAGAGGAPGESIAIDAASAQAVLEGEQIDLEAYVQDWIDEVKQTALKQFPSQKKAEGVYEVTGQATRTFEPGEFEVDGNGVMTASIAVTTDVEVTRPAVKSHFQVGNRGRAIALEPLEFEDGSMDMVFATVPDESGGE